MSKLKIGDKAPEFNAVDQNGQPISLSDYKGKKVILYFYPKDDTPGCTEEACSLSDSYDILSISGYDVIGVSPDSGKSHLSFAKKHNLPFRLIADTDKKVIEAYDVWGEKKMFGKSYEGVLRTTFVISTDLKIENIIEKVNTKNHAKQVMEGKGK